LVVWVVELAERVAAFDAIHEQLEALDDLGVVVTGTS
jgi:hypothetical protein